MLLRPLPPRGHMLLEAMVGGAVLAVVMAGLLSGLNQSAAHFGHALRSQQAMQLAEAQLERLRRLSISQAPWSANPTNAPCPDVTTGDPATAANPLLVLPNTRWQCRLTIEDVSVTLEPGGLLPSNTFTHKRATVEVLYNPGAGGRELSVRLVTQK